MSGWNLMVYGEWDNPMLPKGDNEYWNGSVLVCGNRTDSPMHVARHPMAVAWWDKDRGVWVSGEVYPQQLWFRPSYWQHLPEVPSDAA